MPTFAITGNRPYSAGIDPAQRRYGRDKTHDGVDWFARRGFTTLVTGMAMGPDQWAAIAALRNRLTVKAALPFPAEDQRRRWNEEAREQYNSILATLDPNDIWVACPGGYRFDGYRLRNEHLARVADEFLVVSSGRAHGGTFHMCQLIAQAAKPGVVVNTRQRSVREFHDVNELAAALHLPVTQLLPADFAEEAVA